VHTLGEVDSFYAALIYAYRYRIATFGENLLTTSKVRVKTHLACFFVGHIVFSYILMYLRIHASLLIAYWIVVLLS